MGIAASGPALCLNTPRATRMHLVFCHIAAQVFQAQPVVFSGSTRVYGSGTQRATGAGRRRISCLVGSNEYSRWLHPPVLKMA